MLTSRRLSCESSLQCASRSSPSLKRYMEGSGVAALQDALVDLGFPLPKSYAAKRKPDGKFGAETEAAVRAFQAKYGLLKDGIVGKNTIHKIDFLISSTPNLDSPDPVQTEMDRLRDKTLPLIYRRNAHR